MKHLTFWSVQCRTQRTTYVGRAINVSYFRDVLITTKPWFPWRPTWSLEEKAELSCESTVWPDILIQIDKVVNLSPKGIPRSQRMNKTVDNLLRLWFKCSKQSIPNNEHSGCGENKGSKLPPRQGAYKYTIVLVNTVGVPAMVDTMVGWGVQHPL